jgi:hypothetical protein
VEFTRCYGDDRYQGCKWGRRDRALEGARAGAIYHAISTDFDRTRNLTVTTTVPFIMFARHEVDDATNAFGIRYRSAGQEEDISVPEVVPDHMEAAADEKRRLRGCAKQFEDLLEAILSFP